MCFLVWVWVCLCRCLVFFVVVGVGDVVVVGCEVVTATDVVTCVPVRVDAGVADALDVFVLFSVGALETPDVVPAGVLV